SGAKVGRLRKSKSSISCSWDGMSRKLSFCDGRSRDRGRLRGVSSPWRLSCDETVDRAVTTRWFHSIYVSHDLAPTGQPARREAVLGVTRPPGVKKRAIAAHSARAASL